MLFLARLALVAGVTASLGLVVGMANSLHPALDTVSHFRMHLAAACLVAGLLTLTGGRTIRLAGLALACLAVFSVSTTVNSLRRDGITETETGPGYSLLQLNLRFDNENAGDVLRLIARVQPDLLTLNEVSDRWRPWLERLEGLYPYQHLCRSGTVTGDTAILSRRPFAEEATRDCLEGGGIAIVTADLNGTRVTLTAVHLLWPWPHGQAAELDRVLPQLATHSGPQIVVGDFNATPWSNAVQRTAAATGTRVVATGPTWIWHGLPAAWARWIGLPIDNALLPSEASIAAIERLEPVGSDHLPILVRFRLEARPAPEDGPSARVTAMAGD